MTLYSQHNVKPKNFSTKIIFSSSSYSACQYALIFVSLFFFPISPPLKILTNLIALNITFMSKILNSVLPVTQNKRFILIPDSSFFHNLHPLRNPVGTTFKYIHKPSFITPSTASTLVQTIIFNLPDYNGPVTGLPAFNLAPLTIIREFQSEWSY